MTRKLVVGLVAAMIGLGCGQPEEQGWELGDEPIVIWTIPRPGEEPENNDAPDDPNDDVVDVSDPDDPAMPGGNNGDDFPIDPRDPNIPGREPSAAPVACALDYRAITAPGVIDGALLRGRGDVEEVPCATSIGSEQRFTINVPRRMGVEIWTTWTETDFSPVLMLQSGCDEGTVDLQCSSPLSSHPGDYNSHIRTVLEPGAYTLLIDERNNLGYGEGGAFKVHVDEFELADNALCEGAQTLYPDTTGVVTEDTGSTGDLRSCVPRGSSLRFYKFTVGPRTAVRVEARHIDPPPNTSQGPYVSIRQSCYDACAGAGDYGGVSIANQSDQYQDYIVGVNEWRGLDYEVYQADWASLAENSSCYDPMVVAPGETVSGELLRGSVRHPICGSNESRQLYYSVEVPPYHRLIPEVTNAIVHISQGCGEQCLSEQAPVNENGFGQRYTLRVGDWDGRDAEFQLTPHVVPVANNSTCFAPEPVAVGGSTTGELVRGGNATGTCGLILNNGFTLWYQVEIPAMTTVKLEANPLSGDHPYIGLQVMEPTCGGQCVGYFEPYLNGPGPAVVEMANDDVTAKTYYVAVSSERMDIQAETIEFRVTEL